MTVWLKIHQPLAACATAVKPHHLWREVKVRATANPAAALAVGAGLAWRLLHRPPIASALVGVGLISLWRTDPRYPAPGAHFASRSVELFEAAKARAEDGSAEVHARAGEVRSAANDFMESAAEVVGNTVQASQHTVETKAPRASRWFLRFPQQNEKPSTPNRPRWLASREEGRSSAVRGCRTAPKKARPYRPGFP